MKQDKSSNGEVKRTVVEEGTRFKGDLVSTCPIDVRGMVEGEIEAPSLTVSAKGAVHGRAKVGAVRSEGELSGEFEAETVELSGVVRDKTVIRARSLEVKLSSAKGQQVVFGDCELSIGEEPTEHDAVDEAAMQAPSEPQPSEAPAAAASSAEPPASAGAADDTDSEVPPSEETAAADEHKPVHHSIAEALAAGAGAGESKANGSEQSSGWSQPPSQPPPAE